MLYKLNNLRIVHNVDKFLILISDAKKDIFSKSLDYTSDRDRSFYELQKAGSDPVIEEAAVLMSNFVNLIDDISLNHLFGDIDQMSTEKTVERVILFVAMELIDFLEAGTIREELY